MPKFSDTQIRAIITRSTTPRVVEYPGHSDVRVAVRCLDDIEVDGCRVEAQRKMRDIAKKRGWEPSSFAELDPTLLERFVEREIVLRAFLDADTIDREKPEPFFASEMELARVGAAGIDDLMHVYSEHQEWSNPNLSLTEEDEKELVERLGNEQSAGVFLTGFEPLMHRRLLISMARRLRDYRNGKSSTSTSSPDTTTGG